MLCYKRTTRAFQLPLSFQSPSSPSLPPGICLASILHNTVCGLVSVCLLNSFVISQTLSAVFLLNCYLQFSELHWLDWCCNYESNHCAIQGCLVDPAVSYMYCQVHDLNQVRDICQGHHIIIFCCSLLPATYSLQFIFFDNIEELWILFTYITKEKMKNWKRSFQATSR